MQRAVVIVDIADFVGEIVPDGHWSDTSAMEEHHGAGVIVVAHVQHLVAAGVDVYSASALAVVQWQMSGERRGCMACIRPSNDVVHKLSTSVAQLGHT